MDLIAKGLTYKPEDEFHLNDVSFGMQKGELYTILQNIVRQDDLAEDNCRADHAGRRPHDVR